MTTNQRIRYGKRQDGTLISRRVFTTSSGSQVLVELKPESKTFRIVDAVTGVDVLSGGNTINLAVLKIQAKKSLVSLGVDFAEEERNRGE